MPSFFAMSTKSVQRKATRTSRTSLGVPICDGGRRWLSEVISWWSELPPIWTFTPELGYRANDTSLAVPTSCLTAGSATSSCSGHFMSILYDHSSYVFAEGPFLAMLIFDLRSWLLSPGVRSDMTCVVSETESQCTTQTEDRISTLYQE